MRTMLKWMYRNSSPNFLYGLLCIGGFVLSIIGHVLLQAFVPEVFQDTPGSRPDGGEVRFCLLAVHIGLLTVAIIFSRRMWQDYACHQSMVEHVKAMPGIRPEMVADARQRIADGTLDDTQAAMRAAQRLVAEEFGANVVPAGSSDQPAPPAPQQP